LVVKLVGVEAINTANNVSGEVIGGKSGYLSTISAALRIFLTVGSLLLILDGVE